MKALILAAGYATRLYPLTKDRPKPLLLIKKKPIINYIIEKVDKIKSIDKIMVVTNQRFFKKFILWQSGLSCSKDIGLISDRTLSNKDRLGAIGDIDFVLKNKRLSDDLLVIGADNLFDHFLGSFLKFARQKRSICVGLYNIKDRKLASHYGVVSLNKDSRVIDFAEKPRYPKSSLIAMCLYYFPKNRLRLVSSYLKENRTKDAVGNYINWLSKNFTVFGYIFGGSWYDIGNKSSYCKANRYFKIN